MARRNPSRQCQENKPLDPYILGRNYSVDDIIDDKIENGDMKYLIKWRGFGTEYNLWVSEKKMDCDELKQKYLESKSFEKEAGRLSEMATNFTQNETVSWNKTVTYKVGQILDKTNIFLSKNDSCGAINLINKILEAPKVCECSKILLETSKNDLLLSFNRNYYNFSFNNSDNLDDSDNWEYWDDSDDN